MPPGPLTYPFSAVEGETAAKRALMCLLADDGLHGVLIKGPSGTAKSVLVRSLAGISDKSIVNLPAEAGDEEVFGGIDLEKAISEGVTELKKGLLGRADGNILCIDNINLVDPRTADAVMGAVENGSVTVEREGISAEYPLRTSVVATMNPAERDLPESIADRFEICITTLADSDAQFRADVVEREMAWRERPSEFAARFTGSDAEVRQKIERARSLIPKVKITRRDINDIVMVCKRMNAVGHRGDIACARVARDLAALDGRDRITADDIRDASVMCLQHRRKPKLPPVVKVPVYSDDGEESDDEEISAKEIAEVTKMEKEGVLDIDEDELLKQAEEEGEATKGQDLSEQTQNAQEQQRPEEEEAEPEIPEVEPITVLLDDVQNDLAELDRIEKISLSNVVGHIPRGVQSGGHKGRARGFRIPKDGTTSDPALGPTIRAAAPYQRSREPNGMSLVIEERDIRENIRVRQSLCSFMFAIDVSGSLDNTGMLEEAKKAVRAMLEDSYVRRDRVALLTFGQHLVNLAVPFTRNVDSIFQALSNTVTGGSTPIGQAMLALDKYMNNYIRKNPEQKCYIIMITDGSPDIPVTKGEPWAELKRIISGIKIPDTEWVIIDNGQRNRRINRAMELAAMLNGRYIYIDDLTGRIDEEDAEEEKTQAS
jgi:magnesium chelatase subunit D